MAPDVLYRNLFCHITKGNMFFFMVSVTIFSYFRGHNTNTIIIISVQTVLMSASCHVDVKSQMTPHGALLLA